MEASTGNDVYSSSATVLLLNVLGDSVEVLSTSASVEYKAAEDVVSPSAAVLEVSTVDDVDGSSVELLISDLPCDVVKVVSTWYVVVSVADAVSTLPIELEASMPVDDVKCSGIDVLISLVLGDCVEGVSA